MKKSVFLIFTATISLMLLTSANKPSIKAAKKVLEGFCNFVPSGKAVVEGDTISVQSFYMSETEITNFQYLEFLWYLKKTNQMDKYAIADIDSLNWRTKLAYCEPYVQYYHKHPAYRNYPVVNISKEGAQMYCDWLTEVYDSISNGELKLKFRIPTRAEYMRAARGDHHRWSYSWAGPYIRNSKGNILANFLAFGSSNITRNQETGELEVVKVDLSGREYFSDNADVLAPAKSYWPNEFGFYNLNGNASEMIADSDHVVGGDWKSPGYDIRCESIRPFTQSESTTGFRVVATYIEPLK